METNNDKKENSRIWLPGCLGALLIITLIILLIEPLFEGLYWFIVDGYGWAWIGGGILLILIILLTNDTR